MPVLGTDLRNPSGFLFKGSRVQWFLPVFSLVLTVKVLPRLVAVTSRDNATPSTLKRRKRRLASPHVSVKYRNINLLTIRRRPIRKRLRVD